MKMDQYNMNEIPQEEPIEKSTRAASAGKKNSKKKRRKRRKKIMRSIGRIIAFLLVTVLLACIALYGVMYVLCKGPSPTAAKTFVNSVRQTSAIGFLANLYFTDEEIAEMEKVSDVKEYVATDTSLITIVDPVEKTESGTQGYVDAYGHVDDDGDGIIIEDVKGEGYYGYMMIVLDPTRLALGTPDRFGSAGITVEEMALKYDAAAAINGGGFEDPNGQGNGGTPLGMTVIDGEIKFASSGPNYGFVGFDDQYILHTGNMTPQDARDCNIQFGVCYGPVLITNGVMADPDSLPSGLNPRSAIGQRADGAVLLLVIDGRRATSLGASCQDLADIMMRYGAVNACNLDGGSSALLWYNGAYVNNKASVIGVRPIPTGFIVKKLEG